jgi:hypothetical protein
VDGLAAERVEEDREGGGEGLALAGPHLGDRAVVEDHAADQLDVEMALAEGSLSRLAGERECLGQQVVAGFAVSGALAKLVRARAQLAVVEQLELGLEPIDRVDAVLELLELAPLAQP